MTRMATRVHTQRARAACRFVTNARGACTSPKLTVTRRTSPNRAASLRPQLVIVPGSVAAGVGPREGRNDP